METFNGLIISRSKSKSQNGMWPITLSFLGLALFIRILLIIFSRTPLFVEKYYSSTIYPSMAKSIGLINRIIPFSLGELSLIALVIGFFVSIILFIFKPILLVNNIFKILHWIVRALATVYILFYILWGFNYYRMDLMDIAQMNKEPGTFEELKNLASEVIDELNIIREDLIEDANGVFLIDEDFHRLSSIAQDGFEDLVFGDLYLSGNFSNAKPILISYYMSYTGIMGIYFPYTFEPNINTNIPYHNLLSTINHEMAHQRGFAKEDEANFIAFKTSINNPDKRFQYSGYHLAFQYLMKEIYIESKEDYFLLYTNLSDAVKRDLDYGRDYWNSKEGKAEEVMNTMNDTYLKANNQQDGIKSYNGVVKLLLSDYKNTPRY
ncbi:DUF3810 domain-containing protein [Tissierella sp. Yu-01]|uniref:DUF3810 domain-containing protein n=1 Tax=Tissierella sp. Yu-01 TaxID=3035694 RepID=UPI00240E369D|nr:DUF3810 domain-containing protein [Tissierella sp. Yu-01]WFA08963.1 DUF3810 domain-containing protein [Tissierella sp. Yu-01]